MSISIDNSAFERGTDPVFQFLTLEQAMRIVAHRGDSDLQNRIEELAAKANEGLLSENEESEYHGYARANKFLAVLQAKARKIIAQSKK